MIKLSIKIITITSLTVGWGLYVVPKNGFSLPSPEIKSTKVQNNTIPVALPYDAKVKLKKGRTKSGKMTGWDQQQSMITLTKIGQSGEISMTEITEVEFKGRVNFIHNEQSLTLRGGDDDFDPNTIQTWQEPLSHFKIINAQDGKAEVILSNISKAHLKGIAAVSQNHTYVVDKLSFDHDNNNIILTVIPYSK